MYHHQKTPHHSQSPLETHTESVKSLQRKTYTMNKKPIPPCTIETPLQKRQPWRDSPKTYTSSHILDTHVTPIHRARRSYLWERAWAARWAPPRARPPRRGPRRSRTPWASGSASYRRPRPSRHPRRPPRPPPPAPLATHSAAACSSRVSACTRTAPSCSPPYTTSTSSFSYLKGRSSRGSIQCCFLFLASEEGGRGSFAVVFSGLLVSFDAIFLWEVYRDSGYSDGCCSGLALREMNIDMRKMSWILSLVRGDGWIVDCTRQETILISKCLLWKGEGRKDIL